VLAPGEALLLGRGDDLAVDHQGCSGIVEDGVDSEHAHWPGLLSLVSVRTGGSLPPGSASPLRLSAV
jgi:hypothetical protein